MELLQFKSRCQAKKHFKMAYLGGVKTSVKLLKSYDNGTATYCLYLAPANLSGYDVCPNSKHCKDLCLHGSGRNLMETIANEKNPRLHTITKSRITKTKLFFENLDFFMAWLIAEITVLQKKAINKSMNFSVRLNGTSDINITEFYTNGKNILEIFPDIQFYDYTKVFSRVELLKQYPNYDLTFSYNGYNWDACEKLLKQGYKVAVVFDKSLPKTWHNYEVTDGNTYDMRYLDQGGKIIGLKYHKVANNYKNSKFIPFNSKFVVNTNDIFRGNY